MDSAPTVAVHVLVFPWPRQGLINPMLHLATALLDAGVHVTFLHTEHNLCRIARAPQPRLRLLSIPDGLPDDHPRHYMELMESMCTTGSAAYRALLLSLLPPADDVPPVTCVIADGTMPFATDIAEDLGIPALAFCTFSACSSLAFMSMPKVFELGENPFPADDPVCGVLGMEGILRRRDLPRGPGLCSTEQAGGGDPMILKIGEGVAHSCKARALIINTSASMERPALAHIASHTRDVFAVGPLHASSRAAASASLWREDDGCMAWLDGHGDRSVVYVSLGSIAVISYEQLTEFLSGLAATGYAFLLVLRPGMVQMASSALLREAVAVAQAGKAKIVEWAPQRDVLRHRAVGCFLTHAGWNSTLECAVEGVPMVCWPFFLDQQMNSRLVGAVWRTGLDMKDVCDRAVVEKMVREAMVSGQIKAAAQAMAEQLRLDIADGGSSSSELGRLVRFIRELSVKSGPEPRIT
ncbi:myricetin 3-O-rhamnoside 1,2-glucosyltransferase UGT709G2-like [Aegilops tauschii subsp. strangulata]